MVAQKQKRKRKKGEQVPFMLNIGNGILKKI
jgi:hypothetical protein